MALPPTSDYGRCPCSGTYERRQVEARMTVGEEVLVLTDVPQGACPLCGSRVYKLGVLEVIEAMMRGAPQLRPRVTI